MDLLRFNVGDRVAWRLRPEVRGIVVETRPTWDDVQYHVQWDGSPQWPSPDMADCELMSMIEADGPRRNVPKSRF